MADINAFQETQLVQEMKRRNRPVRALLNGVAAIRNSAENKNGEFEPSIVEYIPKEEKESKAAYQNRLLRTYITPYLKNAISSATGQIFKNPININMNQEREAMPPRITRFVENCDMTGSDLNEFAMRATDESFAYGLSICFVDYHNPSGSENLSEQISSGARPFLKHVSYFDLLGYNYDDEGRITMLRFMEEAAIQDDFIGSDRITQVRVIYPDRYEVYRKDEKGKDQLFESGEIVRFNQASQRITDHVPAAVMYGRKLGTLNAASVFEDMAYINIQHTQVNSDLSWASHFYLIPFLFTILGRDFDGSARDNSQQPVISTLASHINVALPEGSDIKWVETNGSAQEAGANMLRDIERRIEVSKMDSSVAVNSGAKETATGRAIDASSTTAKLKLHAESVESFTKAIIEIAASYMPEVRLPDFSIEANKDFSINLEGSTLSDLSSMAMNNQISLETLLKEIKRRGILADDVDIAMELERIREQSAMSGLI